MGSGKLHRKSKNERLGASRSVPELPKGSRASQKLPEPLRASESILEPPRAYQRVESRQIATRIRPNPNQNQLEFTKNLAMKSQAGASKDRI